MSSRPSTAVSTAGSSPFIVGATTTTIISSPSKRRGSILVSASSALSSLSSFSRRKKPPPLSRPFSPSSLNGPSLNPIVFSEVIEISAESVRKAKEEEAEMERLRDAAAQTLGLGSVLLEDEPFMSMKKEDEDDVQVGMIATAARRGRENLLHDAEEEDGYLDEGGVTPIGDADGLGLGMGGAGLLVPLTPTLATTPTQPLSPLIPITPTSYQQIQQQSLPPPASPTSTLPLSISSISNRARSGSHSHSRSIGHTASRHSPSNSLSRSLTPLPSSSSPVTSIPTLVGGATPSRTNGSPTQIGRAHV